MFEDESGKVNLSGGEQYRLEDLFDFSDIKFGVAKQKTDFASFETDISNNTILCYQYEGMKYELVLNNVDWYALTRNNWDKFLGKGEWTSEQMEIKE